ncbi:MAG: CHAT domain-containing tetratricopeptide repeat protein [Cyclobacteriaceae bacterium]
MKLCAFSLLVFLISSVNASSANYAESGWQSSVEKAHELYRQKKNREARKILLQVDSILTGLPVDSTSAYGYYLLGNIEYRLRNGAEGIAWHRKALEWRERNFSSAHPQLIESYEWIGNIYRYVLRLPYQALPNYEKALAIAENNKATDQEVLRRLTYHLAATYRLIKDLDKAIRYGKKSLEFALQDPYDKVRLASHYNQIATIYQTDGQPDTAVSYYILALAKLPGDKKHFTRRFRYRSNLADALYETGDFERSKDFQNRNLREILDLNPRSDLLGTVYYSLLKMAHLEKNYPKADDYAEKAIEAYAQTFGPKHLRVAEVYRYWGAVYRSEPDRSVSLLDSALAIYLAGQRLEVAGSLIGISDWESLFITLGHKAFALRNAHPRDPSALSEALRYHQLALHVYQQYRYSYLGKQGIIGQARQHAWFWEEALETVALAMRENPGDKALFDFAWELIESGKSALLLQEFKRATAAQEKKIPDSLMTTYRQLIGKQTRLSREPDSDSLYHVEREINKWQKQIATQYPLYHRYMIQTDLVSLSKISGLLKSGEILINYWEGKDKLFVIAQNRENKKFYVIDKDDSWETHFNDFITFLRHPHPAAISGSGAKDAAKAGNYLYRRLIGPTLDWQLTKLVIIPHKNLEKIPFEALLTDPVEEQFFAYQTYPYLINKVIVHYAFSGTHWSRAKENHQHSGSIRMAGISWGMSAGRMGFEALPASATEVSEAAKLWDGKVYTEKQAQERQFRQSAAEVNLLHLALHGLSDTTLSVEPKLIFPMPDNYHDGVLHLSELYNMQMVPETVVLSACESGEGSYASGEGMMSMARGFVFAGCHTVVSNLWPIYDDTAGKLTKQWHTLVADGEAMDVALQKSKQVYIGKATPLEAHPGQWAGMVILGYPDPLIITDNSANILLYLVIAVVLLLGSLFLYRRQS